jgi:glycosyltransferase involved in cell wall biosynthesis
LKFLEALYYLFTLKGEKDIWIRDFYSVLSLSKRRTKGKHVALIFHIDPSQLPWLARLPVFLLEKLFFYRQLRKTDAIVTICEYWKEYFVKRGYNNVYKIYNGFTMSDFEITDDQVLDFKKRFDLGGKPIVYIGNCQKAKGVQEICRELTGLDVTLVTSGEETVKVSAKNLNLGYKDYLCLIKASDMVVEMHKFKTGWSRISQEAMLFKKPVIGSGAGGTRELLEGGRQIICPDFKSLRGGVEYLLHNPKVRQKMGEDGYAYAKSFTMEKFQQEWVDLIKNVIGLQ